MEQRIPGDIRVSIERLLGYIPDHGTIANYLGVPRAWVDHTKRHWRGKSNRPCDRGNCSTTVYGGPTLLEKAAPKAVKRSSEALCKRYREVFADHANRTGRSVEECAILLMNAVIPTRPLAPTTFVLDTHPRKEASGGQI